MLNKRAVGILEGLFGIILSVIALFFVVQIALSLLTSSDSNEEIAKKQAENIARFVDFARDANQNSNCFYALKIGNQELFQSSSSQKFFFLIDTQGVRVLDFSIYERILRAEISDLGTSEMGSFLEGSGVSTYSSIGFIDNLFSRNSDFITYNFVGGPLELRYDKTSEGINILNSISFGLLANPSSSIEFEEVSFILLVPDFSSNSNKYFTRAVYADGRLGPENSQGRYLTFNPNGNYFFASGNKYSESFLHRGLCSRLHFMDEADEGRYLSLDFDHINFDIEFSEGYFWRGRPVCEEGCDEEIAGVSSFSEFNRTLSQRGVEIVGISNELSYSELQRGNRLGIPFDEVFRNLSPSDLGISFSDLRIPSLPFGGGGGLPVELYGEEFYEYRVSYGRGQLFYYILLRDGHIWHYIPHNLSDIGSEHSFSSEEEFSEFLAGGSFYSFRKEFLRKLERNRSSQEFYLGSNRVFVRESSNLIFPPDFDEGNIMLSVDLLDSNLNKIEFYFFLSEEAFDSVRNFPYEVPR